MKKKKKKYNQGGLAQGNPNLIQERQTSQQLSDTAGAIPVWGQIAQADIALTNAVRGDETSGVKNAAATLMNSPLTTIEAFKEGNFKEAIPILGGFSRAKRRREEEAEAESLEARMQRRASMNRSGQVLAGYDSYGKGNFAKGGQLNRISNSAVEVKANNPSKTDSVELSQAFVDNNEIIDNQQRVFSDDLKLPNGKSIAKEAKRLEKMKKEGYENANKHIESRLDKLFAYQQSINGDQGGPAFANGGSMTEPKPDKIAYQNTLGQIYKQREQIQSMDTSISQEELDKPIEPMDRLSDGILSTISRYYDKYIKGNDKIGLDTDKGSFAQGGSMKPAYQEGARIPMNSDFQSTGGGFNWGQAANIAGTFGSNVFNAVQLANTPDVPTPQQENRIALERINDRAQMAEVDRMGRLQRLSTNQNTAQSSTANARNAAILANLISAKNTLRGQTQRSNAEIATREAAMNVGIGARNTQRTNQYRNEKIDRLNRLASLRSQNVADVSNKAMQMRAERNRKDVDLSRLDLIKTMYNDSGVYDRNFQDRVQELINLQSQRGA